jgi:probable rRNA maturation factor
MRAVIKKSIQSALTSESISGCEVSVYITDNGGIRETNAATRNIDSATDVLSFPYLELAAGEKPEAAPRTVDLDSGYIQLGDILISLERAVSQAAEYGHAVSRELGFLSVHSALHLLGYDHTGSDTDTRLMREREEKILNEMGLTR